MLQLENLSIMLLSVTPGSILEIILESFYYAKFNNSNNRF